MQFLQRGQARSGLPEKPRILRGPGKHAAGTLLPGAALVLSNPFGGGVGDRNTPRKPTKRNDLGSPWEANRGHFDSARGTGSPQTTRSPEPHPSSRQKGEVRADILQY
jgi:hypothetical protein